MINLYDFISANANEFRQTKFDNGSKLFIEYNCPLRQNRARVWSHKNCLLYVLSGSKTYAATSASHTSEEGQLLFIRKGGVVLHQHFEKPYRALIFMFDDEAVKQFFLDHPVLGVPASSPGGPVEARTVVALGSTALIRSVFISCLGYIRKINASTGVALGLKFQELLVNMLEHPGAVHFRDYLVEVCNNRHLAFIQLMQENAHYHFTSGELARLAGMGMTTFKQAFREAFGTPPGKWLREQRMARAKVWLADPGRPISEIAFELGYNDVAAFSKAFRAYAGSGPGEYRTARNH